MRGKSLQRTNGAARRVADRYIQSQIKVCNKCRELAKLRPCIDMILVAAVPGSNADTLMQIHSHEAPP